ncbi:PucR family transcriptional regulator ligand-binding domain-containing protein [Pseudoduganella sp. UC29_106]|uniref:PucR family transcriptional regulator ligand-binding domain-containing protein n=1 Tax=Pseudoduganella sp. UC29_106 TaxID=3374553 RepID=UPI003756B192
MGDLVTMGENEVRWYNMDISTALQTTVLRDATVVAGHAGLHNEVRWVHMVDHPEIAAWVKPGYLLLSTGFNWPREDADAKRLICSLKDRELAGVVLAVPHFLDHFPESSTSAANEVGLPLLELPWDIPFSTITEEIHANIIRHQSEIIERSEEIHRSLTNAAVTANSLDDLAKALGNLLGRMVNFIDPDGFVLGSSAGEGSRQGDEHAFMQALNRKVVLRRMQHSMHPILIDAQPGATMPRRLGCPIRIRDELVAIVFVDEGTTPFGELDIRATEHAAIIGALHLTQKELTHREKLAALGAMVAGIAHEINTPIGNCLMVASTLADHMQLLSKTVAEGRSLKRTLLEHDMMEFNVANEILLRNLRRAADLVTSFKQVAVDQRSSQRRVFSLKKAISEVIQSLLPTFDKAGFTVAQNIQDGIMLDSYPEPLGQVITQLINNAVLHGFEGRDAGIVTVSAQENDDGLVELTISDNGTGIVPENLPRIFNPFFTTKLGVGGSGLGLHVCHNIVTGILGGHIRVASDVGVGTTFTLILPTMVLSSA